MATPVSYSNYSQALGALEKNLQSAPGRAMTQGGWYVNNAGSEAARIDSEIGSMKQQRAVDPWSFYRGGAADKLAGMVGQGSPANQYMAKLSQMMTGEFSPDDPSYQWRFDQGQQATERSLAARGLLDSGNAAIELQQYGQGMASQEYAAQFERLLKGMMGVEDTYSSSMNRLMELAGVGNAPVNLGQQQITADLADNFNYQQGMASAMNPPKNPYAGYTFG